MTLPLSMLTLFPESGTVRAFDTVKGQELTLTLSEARTVTGLEGFYREHGLNVNDQVLIRLLEDGRYALTAMVRPKRPDYTRPEAQHAILNKVAELNRPLSEGEVRGLFPDLPAEFNLEALLQTDARLLKQDGRWRPHQAEAEKPVEVVTKAPEPPKSVPPTFERPKRAVVTPYPREVIFPGDAGLNSEDEPIDLSLPHRAREALQTFGFLIEALAHGQLLAIAELGRRTYTVLAHVFPENARLDWAALLARRRETGANYLAVFGAHRDLLRLSAPADLARATLWSWEAVARVRELVRTVPVGPFDLEPHFEQGGLFEHGLERFEKTLGKWIAERGAFSAVLSRLAGMKAPAVFLLDDVQDAELSRDSTLEVLKLLSQAPFHLVNKVDSGEFCLRYPVHQGLLHWSEYALSLRNRLPLRRTERLRGAELDDTSTFDQPAEAVAVETDRGPG
jgi:hypothetical protein